MSSHRLCGRIGRGQRGTTFIMAARVGALMCLTLMADGAWALPPNFADLEVVGSSNGHDELNFPMASVFLPTGEMLIAERLGGVKRVSDPFASVPQAEPYLKIPSNRILDTREEGLIDIAVDPRFEDGTHNYVYLYYISENPRHPRIARFRYTQAPCSPWDNEQCPALSGLLFDPQNLIWQDVEETDANHHHGGGLDFGPNEGTTQSPKHYLYLTLGDQYQYPE